MKNFIRYLIVAGLLIAITSICEASKPTIIRQFDTKFIFQPYPTVNEPIHIKVDITPNYECEYVEVKNVLLDNLTSQELREQRISVKKGETTNFEFSLEIPQGTISGYEFSLRGCNSNSRGVFKCYFAALGDTVLTYLQKPEKTFEEIEENYINPTNFREGPGSIKRREDEKERLEKYPHGYEVRHILDSDGNRIRVTDANRDSIEASYNKRIADWTAEPDTIKPQRYQINFEDGTDSLMTREEIGNLYNQFRSNYDLKRVGDSSFALIKKKEKINSELERMKELEQEPLTNGDSETIVVDGIIYERNKGEYKFQKKTVSIKMDKKTHYDSRIDSISKNLKAGESEYLLDLREPNDMEFVKEYLDSLEPTEQKGFYISKVPLEIRKIFREHGIKGYGIRNSDRENRIKKMIKKMINESSDDKEDPAFYSAQVNAIIFSELFEGYFPGYIWEVGDAVNGSFGSYWDTTSCRKASGAKSVWCSSGDGYYPCDFYDYNLRTYMDMETGIDISEYKNVQLSFRIYSEVGTNDGCAFYYTNTYDGSVPWELYDYVDTTTNTWITKVVDIPADWDSLWIAYLFYSFFESGDEDGSYIDHIVVTGELIQYPNLLPLTYAGWSGPIVPSSITGTTTINTLYYNQPTYFDYSVYNAGQAESEFCKVDIYI